MRASVYNVLAPASNGTDSILYNTASQACAVLSADEAAAYRSCVDGDLPADSELLATLEDMGFLVEDPRAEIDFMRYDFEKYRFNDRVFELYICPTLDCNLNCIYCFENKRQGKMTLETADAIYRFVCEQFENQPYRELKINWYGGEPLLGMDIIEYLSEKFIAFSEEKQLEYIATVVTNGVLLSDEAQEKLKECKVWCVMATADGIGCMHDRTRPSRDGRPTYDKIMDNVDGLLDKDFAVDFRCVIDGVNCESCIELAGKFAHRDNVNVVFNQMRNLTDFEEQDPRAAKIQMVSEKEHARICLEEFLNRNPDAEDFEHLLRPLPVHCIANIDRGYVIDELGNAYKCTSMPGTDRFIMFNVNEPASSRKIDQALIAKCNGANPMDSAECASCAVYPLCKGGCSRTRIHEGVNTCSHFKYTIKDYLTAYSAVL